MISASEHLDTELEVLHRPVRMINSELMGIEADQKHVPQWLEDLELTRGKHCQNFESEVERNRGEND